MTAETARDAAPPRRKLWLCADDYGISPAVSGAIRDLIARGRLNATSVMVTAASFSAAEAAALANAGRAAVGLHFTLTAPFRPASPGYRPCARDGAFMSLALTFAAGLRRKLDPLALSAEAESQFAAFHAAFGRPPDFVDGHQHVQLLPQVSDALIAAMTRLAPGAWIRQCGGVAPLWRRWRDPKGLLLDRLSGRLRARCARFGVPTNPAFAGTYDFRRAKDYAALFAAFLTGLPDGGLVMCHPGFVDGELRRLDDFTAMREQEHAFFAGNRFPAMLAASGMELARRADDATPAR
ncbi:MAG: ChbG/HpnK family deacetylase [Bradyrhizobiaceae bacterium]|nr:ChbG/HpnK family deacetylase [Bradyrhizobiaceae bacterium]